MFKWYSRFFKTAEINSTFYAYPSRRAIQSLQRKAPNNFVFSAKLPRVITHEKRLDPEKNVKNDLIRFLELLEPFAARRKLGCILIQLPPSFTYEHDGGNFKAFLGMIPKGYEFAAEFRHPSWMRKETWKLLEDQGVAYCIVDEPLLPPEVHVTTDFAYFRWHGRGNNPWYDYQYSGDELQEWIPKVEQAKSIVDKAYGYFNNHFHGYAVENCAEILEMLGASKPKHEGIRKRIIDYNLHKRPVLTEQTLDMFRVTNTKSN
jgi:uncharacterized protein YecE (DUF72 family)